LIANNTISIPGTQRGGIQISNASSAHRYLSIHNNIMIGMNGTNGSSSHGAAVNFQPGSTINDMAHSMRSNSWFNCFVGPKVAVGKTIFDTDAFEELAEDPFVREGLDTFDNRFRYWAPKNIGGLWSGGFGVGYRGAIAPAMRQLISSGMGGGISG
jgi:hypothetical protein